MKITNPTDEKHELIIDSKRDGKTSEIAERLTLIWEQLQKSFVPISQRPIETLPSGE